MRQCPEIGPLGQKVLISAGSNASEVISDATELVLKCKRLLSDALNVAVVSSRIYRTPAFPAGTGPDFANAVFQLRTTLAADQLLQALHAIEAQAGRTRAVRWGQRTLDLDLIAYGDCIGPDRDTWQHWYALPLAQQMKEAPAALILPHPRVQDRPFVLVPLRDVCPDWVHPVLGQSVAEMLAACDPAEISQIIPLS